MARKNGCPFSVRNWVIEVLSAVSTPAAPKWLRVKGLTSITYSNEADTEDGSTGDSLWSEPYVTKRNGTFSLEGKPITGSDGARDPGQAQLDYYATLGGADGDATIRMADPYGRAMELDVVVTTAKRGADDTSETISWDMKVVGEPVDLTYKPVTAVSVLDGMTTANSLNLTAGATKTLAVVIEPSGASNTKFSVQSADPAKVRVTNVDGLKFDVIGVAASDGPVDVVVKTMNNALTATVAVTVA